MRLRPGLLAAIAALCVAATAVLGGRLLFEEHAAVQESLARMPAKLQAEWLQKRGLDASRYTEYHRPESTGLRLVGKYGRGPSNEVTGRGNLVALTLGSEVALLSFAKPDSPVVLSEIQLSFIPVQTALHDSFLLTGGNGIEVWNIADSTHPVFRNVIPYAVSDFAVFDTFLYFGSAGTFYAYSIGRPASVYELGRCADSGYVVTATRNVAVTKEPNDAMGFIDVSNPATPKRAGSYPNYALAADARGNICCAAIYWSTFDDHFRFDILDISDPANVRRIGSIDSVGGWDVHLSGPLAFVSGFQTSEYELTIVEVQDSTHPHVVSSCATPSNNYGVWADWTSNWAYIADMVGMAVMDVSNLNSPVYDTTVLAAHIAEDVSLDHGRAYVADGAAGLRVLDATNPAAPEDLGGLDTVNCVTLSAVGQDSFAFIGWPQPPFLRTIDLTDPTRPRTAGGCSIFDWPRDMILRDSLVYVAQAYRFQVVNVARPREPKLVGSCMLGDYSYGLSLVDSLAFAASYPFAIINVKDPTTPVIVGTIPRGAWNGSMRDTFLFLSSGGVLVYSIADPTQPRLLDSLSLGANTYWVEAVDTLLYTGNSDGVHVVDANDVHDMRALAFSSTPDFVNRLTYAPPYVYAACWRGGVGIFDTLVTGISESQPTRTPECWLGIRSSITKGIAFIEFSETGGEEVHLQLFDIAGNELGRADVPTVGHGTTRHQLDLTSKPAGVYIVRVNVGDRAYRLRITKLQ